MPLLLIYSLKFTPAFLANRAFVSPGNGHAFMAENIFLVRIFPPLT